MQIFLGPFCLAATFLGEKESVEIRGTLLPSSGSKTKTKQNKTARKIKETGQSNA